jgi:hypothetical protein
MFELLDAKDKILDLMAEELGGEQDIIAKILRDFRTCKPNGNHIADNYEQVSSLRGGLRNLFEQCLNWPGGLVVLRHVTARYISKPGSRADFKRFIAEYASLDDRLASDDKKELLEFIVASDAGHPVTLVFLDNYSTQELDCARKVLLKLAQPGEVYHVQSSGWPASFSNMDDFNFKLFLKATLSSGSPEATEVFRHQINSAVVSSRPYLLVLVEQTGFFDKPYQFRHEIVYEGCSEPVKLQEQRSNHGAYQTGTMDDFTKIVSPWINTAKQIYPNLLLEIFLPDELLLISTSIDIEIISGGNATKVPLWSCGVPAVIRPLCRAEKAGKKIASESRTYVDPLFSEKWETLRCGNGVLHSVCHQQLVELRYLRPRLSQQKLVGAIMLIDLPLAMGDREVVFGEVIDNGLTFFAWWKPNPEKGALTFVDSASLATTRLKYIADLFGLQGLSDVSAADLEDPNCDLDDLQAPAHLHAMETVAEELRRRASRPRQTWVHDLMLLVDHPERWPNLILYEQELGGGLQSPI